MQSALLARYPPVGLTAAAGFGWAEMVAGEQASLDAGDTHLALSVFGQNAVAIGLYRSMGYVAYKAERACDL